MSIVEFQQSLQTLIATDFKLDNLEQLLSPIPYYTNNQIFVSHFMEIVKIVTQDRDHDQKFTVNDLLLFSKDIIAMTTLITSILLILNSIPNIKITYTEGETEQLVFKLIVYVFFVIIPKYTGLHFTQEEKTAVLNVSILVYMSLTESRQLRNLTIKVLGWFKNKWVVCCTNQSVIDKKMPALHQQLNNVINKI